ncbi:hypothetical protein T552_02662 [Pneumocystis carinii B80]|uniref:Uncharacterized protein n=1 Tax=Pneumocystis carinii (strain B80) TaxID=1408658 RepID=A0A0W4ZE40_PNEC8|nr:hypothetical protein T552_02662 [Pneumocystis carinii B80]KTW26653.1 hypothetical protein T552_02662 [Pneumocystis carinii B80]
MKESNYFGKKELRFARFYKSKASELLIDAAVPTLALQIEELTPIIIIPRKTCLDTLSKHSMCSVSLESNLCYQNQSLRIHNTVLTDSGSSPFFNRFFNVQQDFSEHGYVSFPSLDLYSQDKRSSSIYN